MAGKAHLYHNEKLLWSTGWNVEDHNLHMFTLRTNADTTESAFKCFEHHYFLYWANPSYFISIDPCEGEYCNQ